MTRQLAPNKIRERRIAAGIATELEMAERLGIEAVYYSRFEAGMAFPPKAELEGIVAAIGVPIQELYPDNWRQALGQEPGPPATHYDFSAHFEFLRGPEKLLVTPEETVWSERRPRPAGDVDAFLSLSCSTRASPHLLQDTMSVFDALGVSFVAAAGPGGCCGSPYSRQGLPDTEESFTRSKALHAASIGASLNVNWCTNCQLRLPKLAEERAKREGTAPPVRDVHVLNFIEDRLRELGDRVPWKRTLGRHVAAEGHDSWSEVHREAQAASARILAMIPGVEVTMLYDGHSDDISPCGGRVGRPASAPPWTPALTRDEIRERRTKIARKFTALGADTISCMHQGCHQMWSRYATDEVGVVHAVSVLAEALGCAHPDRYQAAARLSDPAQVVEQTRPIWTAWGMEEGQALALAAELADPRYDQGPLESTCGSGTCGQELISVDVLNAKTSRVHVGAGAHAR